MYSSHQLSQTQLLSFHQESEPQKNGNANFAGVNPKKLFLGDKDQISARSFSSHLCSPKSTKHNSLQNLTLSIGNFSKSHHAMPKIDSQCVEETPFQGESRIKLAAALQEVKGQAKLTQEELYKLYPALKYRDYAQQNDYIKFSNIRSSVSQQDCMKSKDHSTKINQALHRKNNSLEQLKKLTYNLEIDQTLRSTHTLSKVGSSTQYSSSSGFKNFYSAKGSGGQGSVSKPYFMISRGEMNSHPKNFAICENNSPDQPPKPNHHKIFLKIGSGCCSDAHFKRMEKKNKFLKEMNLLTSNTPFFKTDLKMHEDATKHSSNESTLFFSRDNKQSLHTSGKFTQRESFYNSSLEKTGLSSEDRQIKEKQQKEKDNLKSHCFMIDEQLNQINLWKSYILNKKKREQEQSQQQYQQESQQVKENKPIYQPRGEKLPQKNQQSQTENNERDEKKWKIFGKNIHLRGDSEVRQREDKFIEEMISQLKLEEETKMRIVRMEQVAELQRILYMRQRETFLEIDEFEKHIQEIVKQRIQEREKKKEKPLQFAHLDHSSNEISPIIYHQEQIFKQYKEQTNQQQVDKTTLPISKQQEKIKDKNVEQPQWLALCIEEQKRASFSNKQNKFWENVEKQQDSHRNSLFIWPEWNRITQKRNELEEDLQQNVDQQQEYSSQEELDGQEFAENDQAINQQKKRNPLKKNDKKLNLKNNLLQDTNQEVQSPLKGDSQSPLKRDFGVQQNENREDLTTNQLMKIYQKNQEPQINGNEASIQNILESDEQQRHNPQEEDQNFSKSPNKLSRNNTQSFSKEQEGEQSKGPTNSKSKIYFNITEKKKSSQPNLLKQDEEEERIDQGWQEGKKYQFQFNKKIDSSKENILSEYSEENDSHLFTGHRYSEESQGNVENKQDPSKQSTKSKKSKIKIVEEKKKLHAIQTKLSQGKSQIFKGKVPTDENNMIEQDCGQQSLLKDVVDKGQQIENNGNEVNNKKIHKSDKELQLGQSYSMPKYQQIASNSKKDVSSFVSDQEESIHDKGETTKNNKTPFTSLKGVIKQKKAMISSFSYLNQDINDNSEQQSPSVSQKRQLNLKGKKDALLNLIPNSSKKFENGGNSPLMKSKKNASSALQKALGTIKTPQNTNLINLKQADQPPKESPRQILEKLFPDIKKQLIDKFSVKKPSVSALSGISLYNVMIDSLQDLNDQAVQLREEGLLSSKNMKKTQPIVNLSLIKQKIVAKNQKGNPPPSGSHPSNQNVEITKLFEHKDGMKVSQKRKMIEQILLKLEEQAEEGDGNLDPLIYGQLKEELKRINMNEEMQIQNEGKRQLDSFDDVEESKGLKFSEMIQIDKKNALYRDLDYQDLDADIIDMLALFAKQNDNKQDEKLRKIFFKMQTLKLQKGIQEKQGIGPIIDHILQQGISLEELKLLEKEKENENLSKAEADSVDPEFRNKSKEEIEMIIKFKKYQKKLLNILPNLSNQQRKNMKQTACQIKTHAKSVEKYNLG